ncbi:MAG TPA: hypothetical protein VNA25_21940 [Phycisphaerae bacterium]|nr:hypothetical protein [Phycisphaerae bacterium]
MEPQQKPPNPSPGPTGLVQCLMVLAVIAAATGLVGAAAVLISAAGAGSVGATAVFGAIGCCVGGLAAGAAMWALSWLVQHHYETTLLQRRILSLLMATELPVIDPSKPQRPPARPQGAGEPAAGLLAAISELNANLMLTPDERQAKRLRQQQEDGRRLVEQVAAAIDGGEFAEADRLLRQLTDEFPAEPQAEELAGRLAQRRSAAEADDFRQAAGVEDLMALAKFDEARRVAQALAAKYPGSADAAALLARVSREGQTFLTEQCRRLYADVERHAEQRRWRSALTSARLLLSEYGDSSEAQIVSMQLATLEENARIEEVRDLRDRIREYIERRRFAEAVRIAESLVERFPDTAAATELTRQLPRLRELAR